MHLPFIRATPTLPLHAREQTDCDTCRHPILPRSTSLPPYASAHTHMHGTTRFFPFLFQERITSTNKGSITSVQAVYVPADDLTDPAPATTFAHLDATTVSACWRLVLLASCSLPLASVCIVFYRLVLFEPPPRDQCLELF